MKQETKSVPIVWENAQISWTPYKIKSRPDGRVRVTPYFSALVQDFMQREVIVELPYGRGPIEVTQMKFGIYKVGEVGTLKITDTECSYASKDGSYVFSARIPSWERRDGIATAMAIFGACMATTGK